MEYLVIDTNVLINDPKILTRYKDSTILMPIAVIKELDSFKSGFGNIHRNSREVTRILEKIRVKTENGIKLKFIGESEYNSSITDHILLEVAKKYGASIISNDVNVRIQATCEGIKVHDYNSPINVHDDVGYKGFSILPKKFGPKTIKRYSDKPNHYFIENESSKHTIYKVGKDGNLETIKNNTYSDIFGIKALNVYQKMAMNAILDPNISLVCLSGSAGTGKTLISLACALHLINLKLFQRISVGRTIASVGKDIGTLPGDAEEKVLPYLRPIFDNLEVIARANGELNYIDYVKNLKDSKTLTVEQTALMRGRTLSNSLFIIDEAQNMTIHEAKTLITRAGENSKIILLGDPNQVDLPDLDRHNNGLEFVTNAFIGQECFANIVLEKVERSKLAELAIKLLKI